MLVDGAYMGLCVAIAAAPLVVGVALFLFAISSPRRISNIDLVNRGMSIAIQSGMQICVAAVLFGILLGVWPRIPVMLARLAIAFLATFTSPLLFSAYMVGFDQLARSPGPFARLLVTVTAAVVATGYARYVTRQSAQSALAPVTRFAANPPFEVGVQCAVQRWMQRVLEISLPEGSFTLDYDGRKLGSERVLIDGMEVGRGTSVLQLAPNFAFSLGHRRCELHVTGWPWMTIRSLILVVDEHVVYREGW
jgi:hypothetical protein